MNTNQNQYTIKIESHGENLGSNRVSKRYYYMDITYTPPSDNVIEGLINVYNMLVSTWSIYEPVDDHFYGYHFKAFSAGLWWVHVKECVFCKKRYESFLTKWINGNIPVRSFDDKKLLCLRHYVVQHLWSINIIDNKERRIEVTPTTITASLSTNNYKWDISVTREKAIMVVTKGEKKYTFTYKNHANAYPYASSYDEIVSTIFDFLRKYIIEVIKAIKEPSDYNVIMTINGRRYEAFAKRSPESTN